MYNKVKHFTNPILRAEDTRRAFPIVTNTVETQWKPEERATGTAEKQEPNQKQEKRQ